MSTTKRLFLVREMKNIIMVIFNSSIPSSVIIGEAFCWTLGSANNSGGITSSLERRYAKPYRAEEKRVTRQPNRGVSVGEEGGA